MAHLTFIIGSSFIFLYHTNNGKTWWCLRFNEQVTQKWLLYSSASTRHWISREQTPLFMVIPLAWSLVCCQQIPTEPEIDIMQIGMICLPKLFRTMTIKYSVDAPPHILSAHLGFHLCLGFCAHRDPQAPASFCLCLRVESKQDRQEKWLSGDLSSPRNCPQGMRGRCWWISIPAPPSLGETILKHCTQFLRGMPARLSPRCLKQEGPSLTELCWIFSLPSLPFLSPSLLHIQTVCNL